MTSHVLLGFGLVLVLAVASQVLASRLRIPAVLVLLVVGFAAGALTSDANPRRLLGNAFQPLLDLAVALILYDAGLGLSVRHLTGHTRRIVLRMAAFTVPVGVALGAAAVAALLGLSARAAVLTGAILLVTGPAVVSPLLAYVRPAERLRNVLSWEAALILPVGAVIAIGVFFADTAATAGSPGDRIGRFLASLAISLAGGAVGTAALWLLRSLGLAEPLYTTAQVAVVIGVAAWCDVLRQDTGLLAALIMGLAMANVASLAGPPRQPLLDALVQVLAGVALLSVAATVTPAQMARVDLPTLGLVAVLVLIARPVAGLVATRATDLTRRERLFCGWMAPRGPVAALLAVAFAAPLVAADAAGAAKIVPVTLVVVVVTVSLYALTAAPVARCLGVLRSPRSRPLLVGGDDWAIDLGRALQTAGLDVLMWAGLEHQRERIRSASLELAPGELLASAAADRTTLSGITTVLLMTGEDDFNALAAATLRYAVDRVFRVGPPAGGRGVVAPFTGGDVLFSPAVNRSTLASRYEAGARIVALRSVSSLPAGYDLLFLVRADGRLDPATRRRSPGWREGDTVVALTSSAG